MTNEKCKNEYIKYLNDKKKETKLSNKIDFSKPINRPFKWG